MTDREKQIEELRALLFEKSNSANVEPVFTDESGEEHYLPDEAIKVLNDILEKAFIPFLAEVIIDNGYRKMDEVTLRLDLGDRSAEEIKQIAEAFEKAMANEQPLITVPSNEEEIVKRVAKEILQSLKTVFNLRAKEYTNWDTNKVIAVTIDWINADLAETAKEYGVEIDK